MNQPSAAKLAVIEEEALQAKEKAIGTLIIKYTDPCPEVAIESEDYDKTAEFAQLSKMFEDQPVWAKRTLRSCIGKKIDDQTLTRFLRMKTYRFLSGPWRRLWIVIGYDPRQNPSSFIYQMIETRSRRFWQRRKALNQMTASQSSKSVPAEKRSCSQQLNQQQYRELFPDIERLTSRDKEERERLRKMIFSGRLVQAYQLCDLMLLDDDNEEDSTSTTSDADADATSTRTLSSFLCSTDFMPLNPICTERSGWINPSALSELMVLVKDKLHQMFSTEFEGTQNLNLRQLQLVGNKGRKRPAGFDSTPYEIKLRGRRRKGEKAGTGVLSYDTTNLPPQSTSASTSVPAPALALTPAPSAPSEYPDDDEFDSDFDDDERSLLDDNYELRWRRKRLRGGSGVTDMPESGSDSEPHTDLTDEDDEEDFYDEDILDHIRQEDEDDQDTDDFDDEI
eukprot:TRINITY_DN9283_c0_g1_i1.p1 TRINITY_DN9283_c0_g1~~TRINITY_DN9283_c0_g1_i1.p1  ORF type:complete len:450 (-),score=121.62 TRINITY_DN9283_c0_g1_i1:1-1350(-)